MRVYNYASFVRLFRKAATDASMYSLASILFEPIITLRSVLNRNNEPYVVTNKLASSWYNQEADIPGKLKKAADSKEVQNGIEKYFSEKVLDQYLSSVKTEDMINELIALIRNSDLPEEQRKDLERYYEEGNPAKFLGKAFLYAVLQDNRKENLPEETSIEPNEPEQDIQSAFKAFYNATGNFKKPEALKPPPTVANDEIKYVQELFKVYQEKTGKQCGKVEDLEPYPRLKKHFNRQRKDFYLAETIRRGLRDTVRPDETQNFDLLKDEMYDGVITTEEKEFVCGYDRLTAVMEHATTVQLSSNVEMLTLNWAGPGEKKGICHMLVNDDRLHWMECD